MTLDKNRNLQILLYLIQYIKDREDYHMAEKEMIQKNIEDLKQFFGFWVLI